MTNPQQLRPEARPVGWDKLDSQQQRNLDRMIVLLEQAVKALDGERPSGRRGPFLDHHRRSTTALIGGERGTGKTTLLLSLIQALGPDSSSADDSMPLDLSSRVDAIGKRLVWLETLDMEPLETSANLLGAVLARVEATATQPPRLEPLTDLFPSTAREEALQNMARLQTSIALTFSGYLQNQIGKLDPTVFAMESRRVERERLNLKERFHSVLAEFSGLTMGRLGSQQSLFVLPVDDLDLNPTAGVALLQLLRAVQSPHLFIILAADPALMDTVTRMHFRSMFSEISGKAHPTAEDYQKADDVADEAMRKHLPPAQRLRLEKLKPEAVLRFRPFGESQALGELIDQIQLRGNTLKLNQFTVNRRPLTLTVNKASSWPRFYSWQRLFHLAPREAVDIYSQVKQAKEENPRKNALMEWARIAMENATDGPAERAPDAISGRLHEGLETISAKTSIRTYRLTGWDVVIDGASLSTNNSSDYAGAIDIGGEQWGNTSIAHRHESPTVQALRQTEHVSSKGERVVFDWPMPQHSTFWGYERMQATLDAATHQWQDREPLFGSWIAAMTALINEAIEQTSIADVPYCASSWNRLSDALSNLGDNPQIANLWRIEANALCTSEMGMRSRNIAKLIRDPRLGEEIERIILDRRRQLEEAGLRRATRTRLSSTNEE